MGLLADIAIGKLDPIHGDSDNLSDPRTWSFPKKQKAEDPKDDGKVVENDTEQTTDLPDSGNGEST